MVNKMNGILSNNEACASEKKLVAFRGEFTQAHEFLAEATENSSLNESNPYHFHNVIHSIFEANIVCVLNVCILILFFRSLCVCTDIICVVGWGIGWLLLLLLLYFTSSLVFFINDCKIPCAPEKFHPFRFDRCSLIDVKSCR